MANWGLFVESTTGYRTREWTMRQLGSVEGTREEALARLKEHAAGFAPEHPRRPKRKQLHRTADDGFLLTVHGSVDTFTCRFSVAELLYDSDNGGNTGAGT
ncbi:hypothetical protein [Streptomyces daliensis]|uniref:Uncharacterized protein n=1 Tax=Streptomyces daliensis TaxID=299421 RepID=A0A8T4J3I1_9ACTN|nr:hypothetical protein [Streptomyces daliensis]